MGDDQAAIVDYNKAIQIDSGNALIYLNRSVSHRILGNLEQADADKTEACSLDSKAC